MSTPTKRERTSRTRTRILLSCLASLIAVLALQLASCSENATEPTGLSKPSDPNEPADRSKPPPLDFDGVVSEPIIGILSTASSLAQARGAPLGAALAFAGGSETVSFVSLEPGSLPEANSVRILNLASGASVSIPLLEGGFDPVAIPAAVGDTLEIVPFKNNLPQPTMRVMVPARRPPVVVRTDPPDRKTKVPLNASLVVVFSEPFDGNTVNLQTIRLQLSGEPVVGELTQSEDRLRAEFTPASPLQPEMAYTLSVTTGVADLNGETLEEPVEVTFFTALTEITETSLALVDAGRFHTCGVTRGGKAYCWGWNGYGQLGDGQTHPGWVNAPVPVLGGLSFVTISASHNPGADVDVDQVVVSHSCGVTIDGEARCWGYNGYGQLGDGSTTDRTIPVPVSGGLTFVSVEAGSAHTCAATPGGQAYCWGYNHDGWLGVGGGDLVLEPAPVITGLTFSALTVGRWHTCGLTTDGEAYCWGYNQYGQLGDGSTIDRVTPTAVYGGLRFRFIASGGYHTCGITTGGSAYCWGSNGPGQLGSSSTDQCVLCTGSACPPTPTSISTSSASSSAPDLATDCSMTPQPVSGEVVYSVLSPGSLHTCGLEESSGQAYCWGWNLYGQLGDGSSTSRATAAAVSGGLAFVSLSAGNLHTCGVASSGDAYCWGSNEFGQLGVGSYTPTILGTPSPVSWDP